jgi:pimeloyl-ACP methyl ester carboxylesterase/DNA-binding CsgD family transcriptional regulator
MKQEIRFCATSDSVRIAYAAIGQGPPLVKVANWLSHLEFDWQSPVWQHWLEGLAQHHTLIRYDERGCGLSDWHVDNFSFDSWVRDLEAVVDAIDLDRFPLLGMSQGGPIAISYAARHPEKVSRLILYGSYARGALKRNPSSPQIEKAAMLTRLIKLGWGQENPAFRLVFTSLFIPDGTMEQYRWFNDLQRMSTSPENAARIVDGFNQIDVRDVAAKISCPTLVLHARGDARIPFEEGRLLAALIPNARFVPLKSNNHILLKDEPAWSRFLNEIHDFLRTEKSEAKRPTSNEQLSDLTSREIEVLELIAQGLNNSQIAEQLVISPHTVRNHITNIFSKLQVVDRAQAIVKARSAGLGQDITP